MLLKRLKYSLEIKHRTHTVYILIIMIHWIYAYAYITGSTFYEDYTSIAKAEISIREDESKSITIKNETVIGTEEWIRLQWEEAGVSYNEVWAIIQAESSWNSDAWNCNTNGSLDLGLYQGNTIHKDLTPSCALSTICSTKWAIELYKKQGWCPWVASKKLGLCK